ncbi:hypothetical protein ASG51_04845 [Methylobacterium sp. Leaf465]|uniref:DUF2852 domain-containing protein n=1 Tax=unclassified Methylobacterium TaxID=2615210 RepID=UPI0006F7BC6F|nr:MULTISPECIES: DUF2852 domain-containing protein [unclassified Methylobacterium]KQO68833.1 hypothetical protein ASF18_22145 [Methylobacterium sp. Leaf89]KQT79951.1 hypothetical protein ASG51_04845 [Methylobacterium sp. Leaf465]
MSFSSSPFTTGKVCRSGPFPKRSLEIGAIVVAFVYWWPLAAAYIAWKVAGYPALSELRGLAGRGFSWNASATRSRFAAAFESANGGSTGNLAFDAYRRSEIERLDAQRRALQEESRAFAEFVEELKRAKDREQFDAFMQKRRSADATRAV